jgi:copper(I)-binding protein
MEQPNRYEETTMKPMIAALLLAAALPAAAANVQVSDAWARATMPGQKVSAAYMTIRSDADAKLVGVSSAAVPRVELHEMKMDGEVMRMREVGTLALPAGKPVKLEPGGYHIMLMNLDRAIAAGEAVPLTLTIESGGRQETVEVKAEARSPGGEPAQHMHHRH